MVGNSKWKVASAALVLGCLLSSHARAEHIAIVATVNDDVITSTDLNERRDLIMSASDIPPTPENQQRITPHILQTLVDEALELQEAKKQTITITDADVEKAINTMAENKNEDAGTLRKSITSKGLSVRSLENQIRAQLAWNKVVQRKLRRNVTISKDELARAMQAQASDPGAVEDRVTALRLPITGPDKVEHVQKLANDIAASIKAGQDITALVNKYSGKENVQLTPAAWVVEENLPADASKAMQALKPGETSGPLRIANSVQFVKLIERRTIKKPAASTEVMIKQISVDVPVNPSQAILEKVADTEHVLRGNAGTCETEAIPTVPMKTEVKFARVKMGDLTPDQRSTIARLDVGSLSEPLVSPGKMRLILLCERMEASGGSAAEMETVRQQLFTEKMELEAQKHLRNLRREASIDIRDSK